MENHLDRFFDPYIRYLNDIVSYCEYIQSKQLNKTKNVEINKQWLKVYQQFKKTQMSEFEQIICIFAQASEGCILFKSEQTLIVNYKLLKQKCIQSFLEFQNDYKTNAENIDYEDVQITKQYFIARFYSSNTKKVYKYQNNIHQTIQPQLSKNATESNYLFTHVKTDSHITLDGSLSYHYQHQNEQSIKEYENAKKLIKQQTFDKKVKLLEELIIANYFGQSRIPYAELEKKFTLFYGELSLEVIKTLDLIKLQDKYIHINWLTVARNGGKLKSQQK